VTGRGVWLVGPLVALGSSALILLVYFGIRSGIRERARCTENGGHWARVHCREVEDQLCSTTDFGNGMVITTCTPTTSTVCDEVCRGARAEVQP